MNAQRTVIANNRYYCFRMTECENDKHKSIILLVDSSNTGRAFKKKEEKQENKMLAFYGQYMIFLFVHRMWCKSYKLNLYYKMFMGHCLYTFFFFIFWTWMR